jgi:hypothetical protein
MYSGRASSSRYLVTFRKIVEIALTFGMQLLMQREIHWFLSHNVSNINIPNTY